MSPARALKMYLFSQLDLMVISVPCTMVYLIILLHFILGMFQAGRSWGTGLGYSKLNDYFCKLEYARKIGNNKSVTRDYTRNRIWFIVGKIF